MLSAPAPGDLFRVLNSALGRLENFSYCINFVDFDQLSYTELIIKLMNSQNFSVNSHLLKFVSLCNDLRNNLLSSHADDT